MSVELKPETERLVLGEVARCNFQSMDELSVQGVYAPREKSNAERYSIRQISLIELSTTF